MPSRKVYEDEEVIAFHDIRPIAPVHLLLVPKQHVDSLAHCDDSHQAMLGRLMLLAPRLAREQGLADGFRLVVNTGRAGHQVVFHLHLHVIGQGMPRMSETLNQL